MSVPETSISEYLLQLNENLLPVEELARGHKEMLERRGWSPAIAEQMAATLYIHMISSIFKSIPSQG